VRKGLDRRGRSDRGRRRHTAQRGRRAIQLGARGGRRGGAHGAPVCARAQRHSPERLTANALLDGLLGAEVHYVERARIGRRRWRGSRRRCGVRAVRPCEFRFALRPRSARWGLRRAVGEMVQQGVVPERHHPLHIVGRHAGRPWWRDARSTACPRACWGSAPTIPPIRFATRCGASSPGWETCLA